MPSSLHSVFVLLVNIAIPLASFVAGLRATDPLWLWKRPGLLGRSLLAILVIVPVVSAIVVEVLAPEDRLLRAGIVVAILSVGIGPPDLMREARSRDDKACYQIGLDVAVLTLAIVFLPAAVALHGLVFGHYVAISSAQVARVVLLQALLPFLAGIGLLRLRPALGPSAERWAERFVNLVMLLVVLFALVLGFRGLIGVGVHGWLTCAAIAMLALLIGHALGGPEPSTRTVLAMFSAMRFPGLALLITSSVPRGARLIPVILVYVVCSAVLTAVYRAALTRRAALRARTAT